MTNTKHSPHFFARESDGSVRLRMRFSPEEASLFEEAAGRTPLMNWMHQSLVERAREEIASSRAAREHVPPPS